MFLIKEGDHTIDLDYVFRITKDPAVSDTRCCIKFEFKQESESWSKYFFDTEEQRDEYFEAVNEFIGAKEVEIDVIGKLN